MSTDWAGEERLVGECLYGQDGGLCELMGAIGLGERAVENSGAV